MNHNLTLNNRNEMTLSGIKKVNSSVPTQIIATIEGGLITINGANLSVERLDTKDGSLAVRGTVNQIKYGNSASKSFSLRNIFK